VTTILIQYRSEQDCRCQHLNPVHCGFLIPHTHINSDFLHFLMWFSISVSILITSLLIISKSTPTASKWRHTCSTGIFVHFYHKEFIWIALIWRLHKLYSHGPLCFEFVVRNSPASHPSFDTTTNTGSTEDVYVRIQLHTESYSKDYTLSIRDSGM